MARIAKAKQFETSWDLHRDVEAITKEINAARNMAGQATIIFLREYHNSPFDVERRQKVFENIKDSDDIVSVFERTLYPGGEKDNHIQERNEFKSSDDGRNAQTVGFLKDYLEGSKSFSKTIVFFFGGLHEPYLKGYIEKTFPGTMLVNWTVVPSMKESIETMPTAHHASRFVMAGTLPAGYNQTKRDDHRMQMLEKGRVVEGFNLDIATPDNLVNGSGPVYAIFFIDKAENDKYRKYAKEDGVTTLQYARINGANRVVARLIKRENIARAEAGTLKDSKSL